MGQAERDRRRVERLEIERQHMEQKALEEAELLNPPDPAEALNQLEPNVEWGENPCRQCCALVCCGSRAVQSNVLIQRRGKKTPHP